MLWIEIKLGVTMTSEEYERQMAHLMRMAQNPGFKPYAWARAKELDACGSRLFRGIADDLAQRMAQIEKKD